MPSDILVDNRIHTNACAEFDTKEVWKARAKRFRILLSKDFGQNIPLSKALECMAALEGVRNWDTLCSTSGNKDEKNSNDASTNERFEWILNLERDLSRHTNLFCVAGDTGCGASRLLYHTANVLSKRNGGHRVILCSDIKEYDLSNQVIWREKDDFFNSHDYLYLKSNSDLIIIDNLRDKISGALTLSLLRSGVNVMVSIHAASDKIHTIKRLEDLLGVKEEDIKGLVENIRFAWPGQMKTC